MSGATRQASWPIPRSPPPHHIGRLRTHPRRVAGFTGGAQAGGGLGAEWPRARAVRTLNFRARRSRVRRRIASQALRTPQQTLLPCETPRTTMHGVLGRSSSRRGLPGGARGWAHGGLSRVRIARALLLRLQGAGRARLRGGAPHPFFFSTPPTARRQWCVVMRPSVACARCAGGAAVRKHCCCLVKYFRGADHTLSRRLMESAVGRGVPVAISWCQGDCVRGAPGSRPALC